MKKAYPLFVFFMSVILLSACPLNSSGNGDTKTVDIKTGRVTFVNESSYMVRVHRDAFSGPVLIESLDRQKTVDVRTSDNYGIGSTFCVEYSYKVIDNIELDDGEVWAKGIDPNVQINLVVEENKSYTVQIPQPTSLEFPTTFIWITNASDMQFELRRYGTVFKQAGNGNISVPSLKIGVYAIPSSAAGTVFSGYSVHSVFNAVDMADFTAKNSWVHYFVYDGSSVIPDPDNRDYKIIF